MRKRRACSNEMTSQWVYEVGMMRAASTHFTRVRPSVFEPSKEHLLYSRKKLGSYWISISSNNTHRAVRSVGNTDSVWSCTNNCYSLWG